MTLSKRGLASLIGAGCAAVVATTLFSALPGSAVGASGPLATKPGTTWSQGNTQVVLLSGPPNNFVPIDTTPTLPAGSYTYNFAIDAECNRARGRTGPSFEIHPGKYIESLADLRWVLIRPHDTRGGTLSECLGDCLGQGAGAGREVGISTVNRRDRVGADRQGVGAESGGAAGEGHAADAGARVFEHDGSGRCSRTGRHRIDGRGEHNQLAEYRRIDTGR